MKRFLIALVAVAALALPAASTARVSPNVACGPQCGSGDGRPPCQDWNLGSRWTAPNGSHWVCARVNYNDIWVQI